MFTLIERLPGGVVGLEAHGRITLADRRSVLAPKIDAARRSGGKVKLLYVTGTDFAGYDRSALLDDIVFGTRRFTDFERIAFVGVEGAYARAIDALDGLMPAMLRRFDRRDIERAKAWLAG